ncbi:DUF4062 domain-containing protein [Paenibacillaceae bacterium]|nr:DUF4062 domain-containing protein [Paenibacillaceae bacterium]
MRLAVKTKIFISSVGQDEFIRTRSNVFDELTGMGHEPLMYERNFGPWDSMRTAIRRCLDKVDESDIFLLFINDKAGSFYESADRTITHLEFMQAFQQNKTILTFVASTVKNSYFSNIKALIDEYIHHYKHENGKYPRAAEIVGRLRHHERVPSHIDPYVWFFIHDLVEKGIYFEELSLGVPIDWKAYFSDLLRRGVLLLPLENYFEVTAKSLNRHEQFYEFVMSCQPAISLSEQHIESFLTIIMKSMDGGTISHHYGEYLAEDIGTYGPCSAVTLFKRLGSQLVFVAKSGAAAGKPRYQLDAPGSYVAITYRTPHPEQVFFKEDNLTFYLCLKIGNCVLTMHFPGDETWNNDRFMAFRDSILYGIITKNPLMLEYVRGLIGGMQL